MPNKNLFLKTISKPQGTDLLVFGWLFLWTFFLIVKTWGLFQDDEFITLTFAERLAQGEGWTWQTGERVFGNTTPLYTLICSFLYLVVGHDWLPYANNIFSCTAITLQAAVWYLLIRKYSSVTALLSVFLVLCVPQMIWHVGMEANFLSLLLTCAVYFWMTDRLKWAGLFLGLGFLVRYDAVLLALLILLFHWVRTRTFPTNSVLIYSITILPWLIFSLFYFGDILPNSFYVKTGSAHFFPALNSYLFTLAHNALIELEFSFTRSEFPLVLLLAGIGLPFLLKWDKRFLILLLYPAVVYLGYASIGAPRLHQWEIQAGHSFFVFLIAVCVAVVLEKFIEKIPVVRSYPWTKLGVVGLFCFLFVHSALKNHENWDWETQQFTKYRSDLYLDEMVPWFKRWLPTNEPYAFYEIGMLGYNLSNPLYDWIGLVNPHFPAQTFWTKVDYVLGIDHNINVEISMQKYFLVREFKSSKFGPVFLFHRRFPGHEAVPALERFWERWTRLRIPADFRIFWLQKLQNQSPSLSFPEWLVIMFERIGWTVPNEPDGKWIIAGYAAVYERSPSVDEFWYWMNLWKDEQVTPFQILDRIKSPSPGFYKKMIANETELQSDPNTPPLTRRGLAEGLIHDFLKTYEIGHPTYSDWEIALFLNRVYHRLLDRKPDPIGMGDWARAIRGQGYDYLDVTLGLMNSPEFRNRYRSRL